VFFSQKISQPHILCRVKTPFYSRNLIPLLFSISYTFNFETASEGGVAGKGFYLPPVSLFSRGGKIKKAKGRVGRVFYLNFFVKFLLFLDKTLPL